MILSMILSLSTVWTYILGAIAFLFILGSIILIHEGGHFYFASRAGILCREYAFGMGPQLLKKKKGETTYSLRAFPIGGFCAICGEEGEQDPLEGLKTIRFEEIDGVIKKIYLPTDGKKPCNLFDDIPEYELVKYDLYDKEDTGNLYITIKEGEVERTIPVDSKACYVYGIGRHSDESLPKEMRLKKYTEEFQIGPHNRTLDSKKIGQRFLVMFGGPLMNFVLAIVAFFISTLISGTTNYNSNIIGSIGVDSPAYIVGMDVEDEIQKLESGTLSREVVCWDDIQEFMDDYRNLDVFTDITVTYLDKSENNALTVKTVKPIVYIYSVSMYQDITSEEVKIAELSSKSKAAMSGLETGDIIKKIKVGDGEMKDITSWYEVYQAFASCKDGKTDITVVVDRDGESKECTMTPYSQKLFKKTQSVDIVDIKIGISPTITRNIFKVVRTTFSQMGSSIAQLFNTLGMLIFSSEVGVKDLSGPVGIFSMTTSAVSGGIGYLFYWMGFLSVNVGFMNLLPIPALDGGRILFLVIEAIRKKPVSKKAQDIAINVTYYALLALIVYVTFNDVLRFFK